MVKAYHADLAWVVVMRCWWFCDDGWVPPWLRAEIAGSRYGLGVSEKYVSDVWSRYWLHGTVETHQGRREAPPANQQISVEEDMMILRLIAEKPRMQLKDQHARFHEESSGMTIAYSTFCQAVRRLRLTRHVVRSICYRADMEAAEQWLADFLVDYAQFHIVMIDETSKDMGVLKGSFGYALRGEQCIDRSLACLSHGERISILAAFTIEGFLDWAIIPGTFTSDLFLHVTTEQFVDWRGFVREPMLLSHVGGYPGPRSVVVLDNASVHGDPLFRARLAAVGCEVVFLPPYCWFLSTLDNGGFGFVVRFLRANPQLIQQLGMKGACEQAMMAMGDDEAKASFHRCGWAPYIRITCTKSS